MAEGNGRLHPPATFCPSDGVGVDKARKIGRDCPVTARCLEYALDERIDHGVRALEDPDLVLELAKRKLPLTVCPLSNIRLCVFDDMTAHPLRMMLDRGLMVTVNSDDPAYFGGYMNDNYNAVRQALDLSEQELARIARNSFDASFLDDATKAKYVAEVEAYVKRA